MTLPFLLIVLTTVSQTFDIWQRHERGSPYSPILLHATRPSTSAATRRARGRAHPERQDRRRAYEKHHEKRRLDRNEGNDRTGKPKREVPPPAPDGDPPEESMPSEWWRQRQVRRQAGQRAARPSPPSPSACGRPAPSLPRRPPHIARTERGWHACPRPPDTLGMP